MTLLTIRHTTHYRFETPVSYGLQQVRLTPKSRAGQQVKRWEVSVEGGRVETFFEDEHANSVQLLSLETGAREVIVTAEGEVDLEGNGGIVGAHGGYVPIWMFLRATDRTRRGPGTLGLVRDLRGMENQLEQLHQLSAAIRETVTYQTGSTDVAMTAEESVEHGSGVCQDHAHIFVACARILESPARYVSGYLRMDDREDQEATHAWAEAHIDGLGWVGFDISNGISPDDRYVRVATGFDYEDAAPLRGMRQGEGAEELSVAVTVREGAAQQ